MHFVRSFHVCGIGLSNYLCLAGLSEVVRASTTFDLTNTNGPMELKGCSYKSLLDYSCSRNWNLIGLQEVSKLLRNLLKLASKFSKCPWHLGNLVKIDETRHLLCKYCNKIA